MYYNERLKIMLVLVEFQIVVSLLSNRSHQINKNGIKSFIDLHMHQQKKRRWYSQILTAVLHSSPLYGTNNTNPVMFVRPQAITVRQFSNIVSDVWLSHN